MGQRRLIVFPRFQRIPCPRRPASPTSSERVLNTPDGARIVVWYGKAQAGCSRRCSISTATAAAWPSEPTASARFMGQGWGVYMMAYRGYCGQHRLPTEANNIADARLAYDALVREGVPASVDHPVRRVLGTVNVWGPARRAEKASAGADPGGALYVGAGHRRAGYPFLPVRLLLSDRYETDKVDPPGAGAAADPARQAGRCHTGVHGPQARQAGQRAQAGRHPARGRAQRPLPGRQQRPARWCATGSGGWGARPGQKKRPGWPSGPRSPCVAVCVW